MNERLVGSVTVHRTVNLGNYSSLKVEVTQQFIQDESDAGSTMDTLDKMILAWLNVRGIETEVKAVPR